MHQNRIFYIWENENGVLQVNRIKKPEIQMFEVGVFVDIDEKLPNHMSHFSGKGLPALIMGSYVQLYGRSKSRDYNPFSDTEYITEIINQRHNKQYDLLLRLCADCWSGAAWYPEEVLTPITDKDRIKQYSDELARLEF